VCEKNLPWESKRRFVAQCVPITELDRQHSAPHGRLVTSGGDLLKHHHVTIDRKPRPEDQQHAGGLKGKKKKIPQYFDVRVRHSWTCSLTKDNAVAPVTGLKQCRSGRRASIHVSLPS
jgi:hypothetical protein